MLTMNLTLTDSVLDFVKAEVSRLLPDVKSSHRCEAIGRGLGFGTYAAARAAARTTISDIATVNASAFISYLAEHGFVTSSLPIFHATAKIVLKDVAERVPKLTIWGMGVGRPQITTNGKRETGAEFSKRFREARSELTSDYAVRPFLLSLALLERVTATKTVRAGTGSYWLKHIAENYICRYPDGKELGPHYVPNGAFIAAAVHAGFRFKSSVDEYGYENISVRFNMSRPRLIDLDCEIRPNDAYAEDRRRKQALREEKLRQRQDYLAYRELIRSYRNGGSLQTV